jgi:lipopolysaccharide export LptBFGC system permease protein LptF
LIAARMLFLAGAGWTFLTVVAAAALVSLASGVEAVARGADQVVLGGLAQVPEVLVPLSPVLVLLGAALTAAWMDSRGERTALQALGLGPTRTGISIAIVGTWIGFVQLRVADDGLHAIDAWKRAQNVSEDWVWLPDWRAIQPEKNVAVAASNGDVIPADPYIEPEVLDASIQALKPSTASRYTLAESKGRLAHIEWHARRARVLACGLLCFLGWLPLGATAERQVLTALGVGIAYLSVDTFLRSLAGWGHLPVLVGSWAAPAAMAIGVSLWSRRG